MEEATPSFYVHEQSTALQTFLPVLRPHLPHSNPLYNRLQAPHNIPSRHCVFAATFPPPSPGAATPVPDIFTILFSDRSRHEESQIWTFNSLITRPTPLSQEDQDILSSHVASTVQFLKNLAVPLAPGWPFSPLLRFASVHESMTRSFQAIAKSTEAIPYLSTWNEWLLPISTLSSIPRDPASLPPGYTISRVPEDQLSIVLSTSEIKRQPDTYLILPSVGMLNEDGKLVAWSYIGVDGSFATLYVLPEYRGRGLAKCVGQQLMGRLARGEFKDLGYAGESGWVHSDVKKGNLGSEGVMKALGAEVGWASNYLRVRSDKF
jgi:GNAT superfamily N-acetyltransferase